MESLLVQPTDPGTLSPAVSVNRSAKYCSDAAVLDGLSASIAKNDKVDVSFEELYKSLSLTAKKVIDKLNELLESSLPGGIQSLKAEEWTPEATAERIVTQVTALFSIYAKQNPDLEGEELLNGFMDTIRSGVGQGYGDAFEILESLGAFEFDGVQSGVERTKELIDEKLALYEAKMREQLGIETADDEVSAQSVASSTSDDLLAYGGARTIDIAA